MSARSIRRAAAREARKQAQNAPAAQIPTTAPAAISEARLAANRANAQLSTGPTSETGKRISSMNAVRTGLTGQTVLLPTDDVEAYEAMVAAFIDRYKPESTQERQLVQSLADTQWRLNRIPALEFALFARGRMEFGPAFAEKFPDESEACLSALVDAETITAYAKQFRNLHTQEGRLRRQYQQDLNELTQLQEQRRTDTEQQSSVDAEEQHPAEEQAVHGFVLTSGKSPVTMQAPPTHLDAAA